MWDAMSGSTETSWLIDSFANDFSRDGEMSDVETLRRLLEHVKLRTVDTVSDPPTIEIIVGFDADPTDPKVLTSVSRFPRTQAVIDYLNSSEVQDRLLAPRQRGIILVDVVGYSRYDALGQAAILALLQQAVDTSRFASGLFSSGAIIEQIVPTGDGCYFVFQEHLNDKFARVALAISAGFTVEQLRMRKKFELPIELQHLVEITTACHLGVVDVFQDVAGNRNFFGPGMNDAARILDLGKRAAARRSQPSPAVPNTIFFGAELLPQMTPIADFLNSLQTTQGVEIHDPGNQVDKHDNPHPIYWLTDPPRHLAIAFDSPHGRFQPVFLRV